MRLIDADALKEKAFGKRGGLVHTADVDKMPTIEPEKRVIAEVRIDKDDLREIVDEKMDELILRCKDCKYWNHEVDLTYCSRLDWTGTDADDYCSFGEEKGEDEE